MPAPVPVQGLVPTLRYPGAIDHRRHWPFLEGGPNPDRVLREMLDSVQRDPLVRRLPAGVGPRADERERGE